MKKAIFFTAAMLLFTSAAFSQEGRKPLNIMVGAGYSLGVQVIDFIHNFSRFANNTYPPEEGKPVSSYSSIPFLGGIEYGFKNGFCLGITDCYQSFSRRFIFEAADMTSYRTLVIDHTRIYKRTNISLNTLFYFKNTSHNLKPYIGWRVGFTSWKTSIKQNVPYSPSSWRDEQDDLSDWPSTQIFTGVKYYYRNCGIGLEIAFGTAPYLAQVNLNYRFGKKQNIRKLPNS